MPGIRVFTTVAAAKSEGFEVYDRLNGGGYLLRKNMADRWQLAVVDPTHVPDRPLSRASDLDPEC